MSTKNNKLTEAFNLMPNTFTTHKLNELLTSLGGEKMPTNILHFELSGLAKRITKYQWEKLILDDEDISQQEKIDVCIDYLKAHGFKVMKAVTEYIEI